MNWISRLFTKTKKESKAEEIVTTLNDELDAIREVGSVGGKHYTNAVEHVKQLKRDGKNQEAIQILLSCVEATEAESKFAGDGWGVAPWYYEQLAILYRKEKRFDDEVSILERYAQQNKAPGAKPSKLAERLEKAKHLLERSQ